MWRAESSGGFSLVELVAAMAILALLATLAWPSLASAWARTRRADAVLALLQLQQQQARWRAEHPAYASAEELGAPTTSPDGHYQLAVADASPQGVVLTARAGGRQQADQRCAAFTLELRRADTLLTSTAADGRPNTDTENRQCWGR